MEKETYFIPMYRLPDFRKKVERIRRKCEKYSVPFNYQELGQVTCYQRTVDKASRTISDKATIPVPCMEISAQAEIKNGNYSVVGMVEQRLENLNTVSGTVTLPVSYQSEKPCCSHCGRKLKKAFVLQENETGDFRLVGSSCVEEFTGISLSACAILNEVESYCEDYSTIDDECVCYSISNYADKRLVLLCAVREIAKNGYTKASDSHSTKSVILDCYKKVTESDFSADVISKADSIIAYFRNLESTSEFLHNIKVLCSLETIKISEIGILAYAPVAYDKASRTAESGSEWQGTAGEKIAFTVSEFQPCGRIGSMYGVLYQYKITDTSGNCYWWKSSKEILPVSSGSQISAKVKDHWKSREGVKITSINYCKIK